MMKKAVLALAAVLALVLTASALGDDFSQRNSAKAAPPVGHVGVVQLPTAESGPNSRIS